MAVTINYLFITGQMAIDTPDTLNTLARSSSAPAALDSRPPDEDDDEEGHILSEIEEQEAKKGKTSKKKTTRKQNEQWPDKLYEQLQENHDMLERVLMPRAQTLRETWIKYVEETLRNASDDLYQEMQVGINELIQRSLARRAGAIPPPEASTSTAPPQTSTSTGPPQTSTSTGLPQDIGSNTPFHQMSFNSFMRPYFPSPMCYQFENFSQPTPTSLATPTVTTPPQQQVTTPTDIRSEEYP